MLLVKYWVPIFIQVCSTFIFFHGRSESMRFEVEVQCRVWFCSGHDTVCKPWFCVVMGWIALAWHSHAVPQACYTFIAVSMWPWPMLATHTPAHLPLLHPSAIASWQGPVGQLCSWAAEEPCHWECENQESPWGLQTLLGLSRKLHLSTASQTPFSRWSLKS